MTTTPNPHDALGWLEEDTFADLLGGFLRRGRTMEASAIKRYLRTRIQSTVEAEVAKERERCAKAALGTAETADPQNHGEEEYLAGRMAAADAIRAISPKDTTEGERRDRSS